MKRLVVFLLMGALLMGMLMTGCKSKNLPDTFGAELYNGRFLACEGSEELGTYGFEFMSTIDIPDNPTIEISYDGGKFEYTTKLNKIGESKIDGYLIYTLDLYISKISFDKDMIQIGSMSIYYDTDKYIELIPQRFDIVKLNESGSVTDDADLFYSGMGSKMDSKVINSTIMVNNKATLNEIILSNEAFEVLDSDKIYGKEFTEGEFDVEIAVKYDDNELGEYTRYCGTYVIKYSIDGEECIHLPLYMPISYGGDLEQYYDEVLNK